MERNLFLSEVHWGKIFKSLRTARKETKLREFQFKLIHRTVVTQGELFKYGIKPDDKCCFYGEKDSIDHTFIHCSFTKSFVHFDLIKHIIFKFLQLRRCYYSTLSLIRVEITR